MDELAGWVLGRDGALSEDPPRQHNNNNNRPVRVVVDGKAVGPAKEDVSEDHDVGTIQPGTGDVGGTIPLGEEHVSGEFRDENLGTFH